MVLPRSAFRPVCRMTHQFRFPSNKMVLQRRFASSIENSGSGVSSELRAKGTDNAFNRERQAQKEHAASTSGMWI